MIDIDIVTNETQVLGFIYANTAKGKAWIKRHTDSRAGLITTFPATLVTEVALAIVRDKLVARVTMEPNGHARNAARKRRYVKRATESMACEEAQT